MGICFFFKTDIHKFLFIEGIGILAIILFSVLYYRLIKPYQIISSGMELLREQDFSTRLRPIASSEANAVAAYKDTLVAATAKDVVYTPYFTGVHGNYLQQSIVAAGLDPNNLPHRDKSVMNFGAADDGKSAKAWRDIWGAGQGVGSIDAILPAADIVAQLRSEYHAARNRLTQQLF